MRNAWLLGACLAAGCSVAGADPLDVYLGAGLGYSTVQQSFLPVSVDEHPTGWKVFGGWRPISIFGAEAEYVDLGSKDSSAGTNAQHASASAVAAFLVGYLPQPLPLLDFYGKVGVANLRTNVSNTSSALNPGPITTAVDRSQARFAYGAGVQVKFGAPMLRLEYQGFTNSGGDQSLLSLDFAYNF